MRDYFDDEAVFDLFGTYDEDIRRNLLVIRDIILSTAACTKDVGVLNETIRWGQPSYITTQPKTGSIIRLGPACEGAFAMFFHCQTTLVEEFRMTFGDKLRYEGNRALVWKVGDILDGEMIGHCVREALLYKLRKR